MADFTASTALRDVIGAYLATCAYYITLHDSTGGFAAGDTYTAGIHGELATNYGYTRGTKTLTLTNTNGVLDGADAVWTASGGSIGPVSYAAVWIGAPSAAITSCKLLCVKDTASSAQTASTGNTMTAGIANPITVPTPA